MSFDDVARRMKERHPGDSNFDPSSAPSDPDQIVADAARINYRSGGASGSGDLVFGVILLIVGIAITAITHDSAEREGGTYVIAYGPMIVGVIKIIRGLSRLGG